MLNRQRSFVTVSTILKKMWRICVLAIPSHTQFRSAVDTTSASRRDFTASTFVNGSFHTARRK